MLTFLKHSTPYHHYIPTIFPLHYIPRYVQLYPHSKIPSVTIFLGGVPIIPWMEEILRKLVAGLFYENPVFFFLKGSIAA